MLLRINWEHKRCKHAIERLWARGISVREVKEALQRGQRRRQRPGIWETFHRDYSIVYVEYLLPGKIRKIYPITVKLW
jgi:hypothetical protein